MRLSKVLDDALRPVAKRVMYSAITPTGPIRSAYAAAAHAVEVAREVVELAERSLWATPAFLALCESHGERIAVDRLPYMVGRPRLVLGSDIRFSGRCGIASPRKDGPPPLLEIGDGVFVGHMVSFAVARHVKIGRFVSIGAGTLIADTEGHSHYDPGRPIWEVPASDDDVAPVIIEDGVQISKHCMIWKGVTIGARSVIGAGAVVRSDVPPDSVVMGNPGRVVKRMAVEAKVAS